MRKERATHTRRAALYRQGRGAGGEPWTVKITAYKTYVVATPWRNLTYLVLETDEGLRGVGEARILGKTHTVLEYLKDVRRHFVGHSVYDIEDLYRRFTLLDFG